MKTPILESYMQRAIDVAENGRFRTYPNPATGAVLVKDGKMVAEGCHARAGEKHAEIGCLQNAYMQGIDPAGALMAVTLEPCVHYGRTPPCTEALVRARIGALAYGATDPNPQACGGALKLAEAGITVFGPVLEEKCQDLIADFKVWQTTARPYVILKLASTLDGRIAASNGDASWISGEESRKKVHELRSLVGATGGAILIGGNTFRNDNPQLTSRIENADQAKQPFACILSSSLETSYAESRLVKERAGKTIFLTDPQTAISNNAKFLQSLGCNIMAVPFLDARQANLHIALQLLRKILDIPYVLCEGGGKLAFSLLENNLVDEFHLHLAPVVLGDKKATPLFSGSGFKSLQDALRMRICSIKQNGNDLNLILRPYISTD